MTALVLNWEDSLGYVKFTATGVPANWTIFRQHTDDDGLEPIKGFETSSWLSGGDGFGEDYRPPLGAVVTYMLAPIGSVADGGDSTWARATIAIAGDQAWLRDVTEPILSQKVIVVTTGTETEGIIQKIYEVSGRRLPLVVHDLRQGRTGQVQLLVTAYRDPVTGQVLKSGRQMRRALETLLATGNPLLLSMCNDLLWMPCMMAIADAAFTRVGNQDNWTLDLTYTEVDDPLTYQIDRIADPTYQDVLNGQPVWAGDGPPPVTYGWVKTHFARYIDVATGNRTS